MAFVIVDVRPQLQAKQDLLLVGQIADHTPQRKRERFDQSGRRENSLVFGNSRMLLYIDYLEII